MKTRLPELNFLTQFQKSFFFKNFPQQSPEFCTSTDINLERLSSLKMFHSNVANMQKEICLNFAKQETL